jgi:hypothetical protein
MTAGDVIAARKAGPQCLPSWLPLSRGRKGDCAASRVVGNAGAGLPLCPGALAEQAQGGGDEEPTGERGVNDDDNGEGKAELFDLEHSSDEETGEYYDRTCVRS